ncbi:AraC family transcriptional regulator [Shinella zoogloeoides]|uniref:AraC family transcriptional regulator n=1 Tax=Shinella zoogloeoides TaxID=352475 RepID=UPI00273E61ED|nr:AraC family transcriptional regulator [Shinella zoogloeoides]WLR91859.1 AraC family transcriptional regulator [Shinella zoogloeoides]
MHPVAKAIWYIESHFGRAIALSEIAAMAGMSRHHLSRRFSEMTGQNLNRYLRARRLSVAARQLAGGAQNILTVALEAGYGSHEAFTRAFREEFGLTPEALRARRDLSGLTLQEPIRMSAIDKSNLPSPRIETLDAFVIAGLGADFEPGKAAGIPALWQKFNEYFGHIPGQTDKTAFGLCRMLPGKEGFRYVAGVRVARSDDLPAGFETIHVPAQSWAMFPHESHVNGIAATADAAFRTWLPASGRTIGPFPDVLEFYGEDFDPETGVGRVEIWLPLADQMTNS